MYFSEGICCICVIDIVALLFWHLQYFFSAGEKIGNQPKKLLLCMGLLKLKAKFAFLKILMVESMRILQTICFFSISKRYKLHDIQRNEDGFLLTEKRRKLCLNIIRQQS